MIGIANSGVPVGYLDLWAASDQTKFYVKLENSLSGESIEFTRSASLGAIYKVAIIKGEQKTALYLDGEKVAEVNTWQSESIDIIFRGVNDGESSQHTSTMSGFYGIGKIMMTLVVIRWIPVSGKLLGLRVGVHQL